MDKGFKKISHVEAKKIIDTENSVVILDVREPEEVREGYIDGAVFITNGDILKKAGNVITDKNKKKHVY